MSISLTLLCFKYYIIRVELCYVAPNILTKVTPYLTTIDIMHFQQSAPEAIRIFGSNLEDMPVLTTKSQQTRPPVVALSLAALLALPILQTLGESRGLQPFLATCTLSSIVE